MTYDEAMARYGSDRPDIRFGLEIADLGEALAGTEFKVFSGALGSGGVVRGLNAGAREVPRKDLDALTEHVKRYGAGGLVWAFVQEDGTWRSPIAKFLTEEEIAAVTQRLGGHPGDLLLIVADTEKVAATALGELRLELSRRFELVPPERHEVLWVVDFPAFEYNEGERRWDAVHHPFTTPTGDFADPGAMRARAYDLILDGSEIGGGSIRIHRPEVQQEVFRVLGISEAGGRGALRLPARRDALRRAAARRHRVRARPHRGDRRRARLDPRRHRLPEDRERLGPAHRRARAGRPAAARGARAAPRGAASGGRTARRPGQRPVRGKVTLRTRRRVCR